MEPTSTTRFLRRSYERQGIPCPWRYYNDRDVRTIVELGKAIDFDARTAIPFEGERHNALDDARYRAKYVSAIWQKADPRVRLILNVQLSPVVTGILQPALV